MRAKTPERCPECGSRSVELQNVTSRVFATWACTKCGASWRADHGTGKLIARLTKRELQQEIAGG